MMNAGHFPIITLTASSVVCSPVWTACAWGRSPLLPASGFGTFWAVGTAGGSQFDGIGVTNFTADQDLQTWSTGGAANSFVPEARQRPGLWYFTAIQKSATTTTNLYLRQGSGFFLQAVTTFTAFTPTVLSLGAFGGFPTVDVAGFRVWSNIVLSRNELMQESKSGRAFNRGGLICETIFSPTSSANVWDVSGNGNNFTGGTPSFGPGPNIVTRSKIKTQFLIANPPVVNANNVVFYNTD